jgi:hypothetical protein
MRTSIEQREHAVQRDARLLAALPAAAPSPAALERLHADVDRLALAERHRARLRGLRQVAVGMAAALVLTVGLAGISRTPSDSGGADEALGVWLTALDASTGRLVEVVDAGWVSTGSERDLSAPELDALLDSFDDSLERLDTLLDDNGKWGT